MTLVLACLLGILGLFMCLLYYYLLSVAEGVDVNRKRLDHIEAFLKGDETDAIPRQTKRKADR